MEEQGKLHLEVTKRLLSMKSDKNLMRSDLEVSNPQPSLTDKESELSTKDSEKDFQHDTNFGELLKLDLNDFTPEFMTQKMLKLFARNQELEATLKQMESKARKLEARNTELENELTRKETMRLSQLELLALRNVELEKNLHDAGVTTTAERPVAAGLPAWASWNGKTLRQPNPRSWPAPAASSTPSSAPGNAQAQPQPSIPEI